MDGMVYPVITTRIMVFQPHIPDLFSITFDLDISAHIVGSFQRGMTLDFAGVCHAACKYIARESCSIEAFYPSFKSGNSPSRNLRLVLGGACQYINIRELIVPSEQWIRTIENGLHLTAHFVVVDWSCENQHIGIVNLPYYFGGIVFYYTFACLYARQTTDAETDVLVVEGDKLNFVAAFSSTPAERLGQSVRIAVASQTCGYDKNLFHC